LAADALEAIENREKTDKIIENEAIGGPDTFAIAEKKMIEDEDQKVQAKVFKKVIPIVEKEKESSPLEANA
jgi:hypothetical protein